MTATAKQTQDTPRNQEFWKDKVSVWQASGMSQSAFCKREGYHVGIFNKWKVHFLGKDKAGTVATKMKSRFVPVEIETKQVDLISVSDAMEVTLPNKLVIKIPQGMLPQQVVPYIEALSSVRC